MLEEDDKNIGEEEVFDDAEVDIIDDDGIDFGNEEPEEAGVNEEFSALSFSGARGLDE